MCNQNYLQLVAGESVKLTGVSVSWPRKGWLGWLLGWFWRRRVVIDLAVVKDYRGISYIEASQPDGRLVSIPHYTILDEVYPNALRSPSEQNLWKVVTGLLEPEIAFYLRRCEAQKEASYNELLEGLETLTTPVKWPEKEVMVVLPEVSALATSLSSPGQLKSISPIHTKLVPGVKLLDANKVSEKLTSRSESEVRGMTLMSSHLSVVNQAEGRFKLPTLQGPVWFSRYMSLGKDAYQLRLEKVPTNHLLYPLFLAEKLAGRKVSLWIDRQGLMSTLVDSPAWHLEMYLNQTLLEEPGRRKVAA